MLLAAVLIGLKFMQLGEFAPPETPVRPELFQKPTYGPKLCEVAMSVRVCGKGQGQVGTVSLPVPNGYSGQAVIGFKVVVDPPDALRSWKLEPAPDGLNESVLVTVSPSNRNVTVSYRAIVLAPGFGVVRTQKRDFDRWLAPTALVQSNVSEIVAIAKKLQAGAPSRSELAKRVVKWVAENRPRQGMEQSVDAKTALAGGGATRGRSDLCAAILRAAGIAARTIADVPFWMEGSGVENWLVEYASDDNCWEMLEPTIGLQYPVRNTVVILWILGSEFERAPLPAGSIAPYRPEISPELDWAPATPTTPTTIPHVIRTFPMQSGPRLMIAAQRRHIRVVNAAESGTPSWIDEQLMTRILSKGPINLALYLDGKPTMPDRDMRSRG